MQENVRESAEESITVWEVAQILQKPVEGFEDTYEMHNATVRRQLLDGNLGEARDQIVLLFLDVAKFFHKKIEDPVELQQFCSKVITEITKDRLPKETIDKVVDILENQFLTP